MLCATGQAQGVPSADPVILDSLSLATENPMVVSSPEVSYPESLYVTKNNTVWLELFIDSTGTVIRAEVKTSTDHRLDLHATSLAYMYKFTPAKLDGETRSLFRFHYSITFRPLSKVR